MAAKKVNKSNVRQDDPYDAANYNRATDVASKKRWTETEKNMYFKEVGRFGDNVMFDSFRKNTGGMGGKTMTSPVFLRDEAQQRDNGATLKANVTKAKKTDKTKLPKK